MMRSILCILFVVLADPAVSAADTAAFVVDYDLRGGAIAIQPGSGGSVDPGVGLQLQVGDTVRVSGGAVITLDSGRGAPTVLTAAGSPFTVPSVGPGGELWGRIAQIMEIVRWQVRTETVSARTRNDYALAVPLLEVDAPVLKLPAGPRTLTIGWLDGTFPVRWRVVADGRTLADVTAQADRRVTIPISLLPGPAEIRVADAGGRERVFRLDVVAAPPAAILEQTASASSPLGRMAAAAVLSRIEGGAFILEAAGLLSTPQATQAETALRAALEMGERP